MKKDSDQSYSYHGTGTQKCKKHCQWGAKYMADIRSNTIDIRTQTIRCNTVVRTYRISGTACGRTASAGCHHNSQHQTYQYC